MLVKLPNNLYPGLKKDIHGDTSNMLEQGECIQMCISIVYIDTYANDHIMLLCPQLIVECQVNFINFWKGINIRWKRKEKQVCFGPVI